jgi:hypothetical protein
VERIEKEQPEAAAGPEKQLLSVDGAMVPLVGGEWAEVNRRIGERETEKTDHRFTYSPFRRFSRRNSLSWRVG